VGGKLNRKNIEGTAHRKAEGDREPAFFAKGKNKEEKSAETKECGEGSGIAIENLGDQVWGSNKKGQGDESADHLLGREILHEP
jgi:hypothetical protein